MKISLFFAGGNYLVRKKLMSRLLLVTILLATICPVGIAQPGAFKAIGRLKVGVLFPTSGPLSKFGNEAVQGVVAAHQIIEKEAPEIGGKIELVMLDSGNTSKDLKDKAQTLIEKHRVSILIGGLTNSQLLALNSVATAHKVPFVTVANWPSAVGSEYGFTAQPAAKLYGKALAEFSINRKGLDRFLTVYKETSGEAKNVAESFGQYSKALGKKVLATLAMSKEMDIEAIKKKVIEKRPKALVALISGKEVRQLFDSLGGKGKPDVILGTDQFAWSSLKNAVKENRPEIFQLSAFNVRSQAERSLGFVEHYRTQYNRVPSSVAAAGYESFVIVSQAFKQAASIRTGPLLKAFRKMQGAPGLQGDMQADGHFFLKPMIVSQIMSNKINLIETLTL